MVSPAWRLSHAPPIPPVNNFNQIHYPDKSVINCHILHIIFPEFVKESQTMSPSEKQLWFSPEPRDGGTVCHNEAPLPRPSLASALTDKLLLSLRVITTSAKTVLIIHHISPGWHNDHPPPPPWSPLVRVKPQVSGGTRQKTSWGKVYNPSPGHNETGPEEAEEARDWPHKNSVYANPSPLAFNYLGELMNSNGTIYAATTKLETFER